MQQQLGKSDFNEGIFGVTTKKRKQDLQSIAKEARKEKKLIKKNGTIRFNDSDDDAPPIEMSSKQPFPFLGTTRLSLQQLQKQHIRDPRFDNRSGDYNSAKFRRNFDFVFNMKEQEISELKHQLSYAENEEEREKIRFVLQRIQNQIKEHKKQKALIQKSIEQKQEAEKAVSEGKRPPFMKRSDKRITNLVDRYEELKKKGQLEKHIEKRRKKQASLSRKKMKL